MKELDQSATNFELGHDGLYPYRFTLSSGEVGIASRVRVRVRVAGRDSQSTQHKKLLLNDHVDWAANDYRKVQ